MAAAEAEGIPETHDPEPWRGKAALPHDAVTRSLCRLRERVVRKKMEVPGQMIATPVASAEQPVIQSPAARRFDQEEAFFRQLGTELLECGDRIAEMFKDLAHNHQIVRRIPEVFQVRLATFQQTDVCGIGALQNVGLESKIEADAFRFARDGFTKLKQACSVPATDIDDRAESWEIDIRSNTPDVAANLSFINEAMEVERGIRIYGVISWRIKRGDFIRLRNGAQGDVAAFGAPEKREIAWNAGIFVIGTGRFRCLLRVVAERTTPVSAVYSHRT